MTMATNIIDTVIALLDRGYGHDLRSDGETLRDATVDRQIDLQDIAVDAACRFELSPDANATFDFYAITDRRHGAKGLLIDAFDLLKATGNTPLTNLLSKAREPQRD